MFSLQSKSVRESLKRVNLRCCQGGRGGRVVGSGWQPAAARSGSRTKRGERDRGEGKRREGRESCLREGERSQGERGVAWRGVRRKRERDREGVEAMLRKEEITRALGYVR